MIDGWQHRTMASALSLAIVVFGVVAPISLSAEVQSAPPITLPQATTVIWQNDSNHPPNGSEVNETDTLDLVRSLIQLSRQSGDLRALGKAEVLLQQIPASDLDAAVLSAIIDQRKHLFDKAAATLSRVLAAQPNHPQANFTAYSLAVVQGDYQQAGEGCRRLGSIGYKLIEQSCRHNLMGLKGQTQEAFDGLQRVLKNPPPHTPQERAWAQATLAELAAAIKHPDTPALYYQTLALAPEDHYSAAALADWYLQHDKAQSALAILNGRPASDRLDILRLIALRQVGSPEAESLRRAMREQFSSADQRDSAIHLHEHARFLLDVEQQPQAALELAKKNYEIQKERADKRLLERARRAVEASQ